MTIRAIRIVKAAQVGTAFEGRGSRAQGGRWNLPGTAVVYTASSAGLAALEVLVHTETHELLAEYRIIPCDIPRDLVEVLADEELPSRWRESPAPRELASLGTQWALTQESCVLQVPSVLVTLECNYIINPLHPDFGRIAVGVPQKFWFEARLKT